MSALELNLKSLSLESLFHFKTNNGIHCEEGESHLSGYLDCNTVRLISTDLTPLKSSWLWSDMVCLRSSKQELIFTREIIW